MEHTKKIRIYNPEAQAGIIAQAQRDRRLTTETKALKGLRMYDHEGLKWIKINDTVCYAGNCNLQEMRNLRINDMITLILDPEARTDFTFGKSERAVAAVLKGKTTLYRCPAFDLEGYLQEQEASNK